MQHVCSLKVFELQTETIEYETIKYETRLSYKRHHLEIISEKILSNYVQIL